MNWRRGLRRLTAIFWGLFAAFGVMMAFTAYTQPLSQSVLYAALWAGISSVCFLATSWVIDGFTKQS